MKQSALFITFEGCEGCGKSTHSTLLSQFFSKNNINAILTREPGGTVAAEKVRNILLDHNVSLEHTSELLLHFAARIEHVNSVISPALKENKIVICDRFYDSTVAYQHYGHGLDLDIMHKMHKHFLKDLTPDITFLLDIPEDMFFRRKNKKAKGYIDRYEKLDDDFHIRVRNGFLDLALKNKDRYHIIDTSSTNSQNAQDNIIDILTKKLI
jgi:dTMP kinase